MTFRIFAACALSLCALVDLPGCSGGSSGSAAPAAVAANPPLMYPLSSSEGPEATPAPAALGVQNLNLSFTGTSQDQAVLVYEKGYTGNFTVNASCQAAAGAGQGTVPATALFAGATTGAGPGAVLTVVAGATGGTCSFTVTDTNKQQSVLFVGTSLTGGTVS